MPTSGDVVVTVPVRLWGMWIEEGDNAGDAPTGEEWGFYMQRPPPRMVAGDRVYVVAHGKLRGYAPLTRIVVNGRQTVLCRQAGAVAVTIPEPIIGFRGWRYRWWSREVEVPFPDWKIPGSSRRR